MVQFSRISIFEARKRFTSGKAFYICPCKMRPGGGFNMACLILSGKEWANQAEIYTDNPKLWKGTIEKTAWELMYNNWNHYNTSYETGYYAHYYVEA